MGKEKPLIGLELLLWKHENKRDLSSNLPIYKMGMVVGWTSQPYCDVSVRKMHLKPQNSAQNTVRAQLCSFGYFCVYISKYNLNFKKLAGESLRYGHTYVNLKQIFTT